MCGIPGVGKTTLALRAAIGTRRILLVLDDASTAFHEVLTLASASGNQEMIAAAYYGLAQVAHAHGHHDEAQRYGEASLKIYETIGIYMTGEVRQWLAALRTEGR